MGELEHFSSKCGDLRERPNSMNNNGVLMDEVGYTEGFTDRLLDQLIRPLSSIIYPDCGSQLDHHRCFSVKYSHGHDTQLATHFDNAEVTLNVNLALDARTSTGGATAVKKGGDLLFFGRKDGAPRNAPVR